MATIITDLKETFRRGNIYIQLIYINVAVFILTTLTEVMFQLFNRSIAGVFEWLELPASVLRFILQPWSLLTYMFMHAGFMHILFNMLWLYWFGALFLSFFSAKHLRGVYILGGICGGLLYMAAYNIFPYFRPMTDYSFMLGASASVLAIVACAVLLKKTKRQGCMLWIPMVFMMAVTFTALGMTISKLTKALFTTGLDLGNTLQLIFAVLLLILGVLVAIQGVKKLFEKNDEKQTA